jgi:hypothetical protein
MKISGFHWRAATPCDMSNWSFAAIRIVGSHPSTVRLTRHFPGKDPLVRKTDRKAEDWFFERRTGLDRAHVPSVEDGPENFGN